MKKQKFIGGDNNFDSDSDPVGVRGIMGFLSPCKSLLPTPQNNLARKWPMTQEFLATLLVLSHSIRVILLYWSLHETSNASAIGPRLAQS